MMCYLPFNVITIGTLVLFLVFSISTAFPVGDVVGVSAVVVDVAIVGGDDTDNPTANPTIRTKTIINKIHHFLFLIFWIINSQLSSARSPCS